MIGQHQRMAAVITCGIDWHFNPKCFNEAIMGPQEVLMWISLYEKYTVVDVYVETDLLYTIFE